MSVRNYLAQKTVRIPRVTDANLDTKYYHVTVEISFWSVDNLLRYPESEELNLNILWTLYPVGDFTPEGGGTLKVRNYTAGDLGTYTFSSFATDATGKKMLKESITGATTRTVFGHFLDTFTFEFTTTGETRRPISHIVVVDLGDNAIEMKNGTTWNATEKTVYVKQNTGSDYRSNVPYVSGINDTQRCKVYYKHNGEWKAVRSIYYKKGSQWMQERMLDWGYEPLTKQDGVYVDIDYPPQY